MATSHQFELPDPPADAISAIRYGPDNSTRLLVASWDRHVHLYDTNAASGGKLIKKYEHRAPVLDACFGANDDEAFTAGLDWDVRRIDLSTGEQTVLSTHEQGVKAVAYDARTKLLISASWDCTLHVHRPGTPDDSPCTIRLPGKPFALALSPTKLVVAMAARLLHIYDVAGLAALSGQTGQPAPNELQVEPFQQRESSLKFMTRAVACMPNDAGYASSSIEGRVAVEWFDASPESQARKYAFKCHRQPAADGSGVDLVYPVNALAFHPGIGTFASGGGDGVVALWDALAKRRIRQYQRFPASVAALAFSADGRQLAVAVSPGFEDGQEGAVGDVAGSGAIQVVVRELGNDAEARGKASK